jgi:hypothetical protein
MSRPDEGLIHTWLDGELDAAEAARVEALVKSDPEWAAAAAEARGLIAASSRIIGALDDVPGNVVPVTKPVVASPVAAAPSVRPARRTMPSWLRAAAAIVVVAGSAVVLSRQNSVEVPASVLTAKDSPANEVAAAPPAVLPQATAPTDERLPVAPAREKQAAGGGQARAEADAKRTTALGDVAGKSVLQERMAAAPQVAQIQQQAAPQSSQLPTQQQLQVGVRQQSAASGAGAAAAGAPAFARADAAEQRKLQTDSLGALKKEDEKQKVTATAASSGLAATARDAGATGNRVLPEAKALTVTGTPACYRERPIGGVAGLLHRVMRVSDTTAIATEPPLSAGAVMNAQASLRPRDASLTRTTYRVGGDTLFVPLASGETRIAFRAPCP